VVEGGNEGGGGGRGESGGGDDGPGANLCSDDPDGPDREPGGTSGSGSGGNGRTFFLVVPRAVSRSRSLAVPPGSGDIGEVGGEDGDLVWENIGSGGVWSTEAGPAFR
jgi:hypothetical protein